MEYENISAELSDFLIQQSTLIFIMPHFEMDVLQFVSGNFGPFKVNQKTQVPLWVAIHLKKLNKCRIYSYAWLSVEYLKNIKNTETEYHDILSQLPHNYYEIAQILLSNAPDDIKNNQEIQNLLEDIDGLRNTKINNIIKNHLILQKTSLTQTTLQINFISNHEINKRRQILSDTMVKIIDLNQVVTKIIDPKSQQTQSQQ